MKFTGGFISIIFLILLFNLEETWPKGRSKSSRFNSFSRRKTPSYKPKLTGKKKIAIAAGVIPVVWLLTRKRNYAGRQYPGSSNDFIYYDSRELPSSFNVNNNTFWTAFLLVQSKNDVYSCLIVPSKIRKVDCPREFRNHVTRQTKFLLPSAFNSSSKSKTSTDDIALCCLAAGLRSSAVTVAIMSFVTLVYISWIGKPIN